MNRFCFLICALFALILTGCSDDDDALTISSDELKQTTWKVDKRVYSDPDAGEDDYKTSENLIIRFFDGGRSRKPVGLPCLLNAAKLVYFSNIRLLTSDFSLLKERLRLIFYILDKVCRINGYLSIENGRL